MAVQGISAPVGLGSVNRPADVTIIQKLLLARGFTSLGEADGICTDRTIAAIKDYQAGYMRRPDSIVDPGGRTWRMLAADFTGSSPVAPPPGESASVTRPVPRPEASSINQGLSSVSNAVMLDKLGAPRPEGYSTRCQPPTHPRLRSNFVTDSIGPFRVTGLLPAVLSLKAVMADIAREQPEVYRGLGTAGMLCCRWVRGSTTAISNHSWGTAIDLTLNGILDAYGDDKVQYGLTLIAPIFNRHGWFWGAAFRKEDGMHFEGSRSLIDEWAGQLR